MTRKWWHRLTAPLWTALRWSVNHIVFPLWSLAAWGEWRVGTAADWGAASDWSSELNIYTFDVTFNIIHDSRLHRIEEYTLRCVECDQQWDVTNRYADLVTVAEAIKDHRHQHINQPIEVLVDVEVGDLW